MTAKQRRGLPKSEKGAPKASRPARRKRRGVVRSLLRAFIGLITFVTIGAAIFTGARCYPGRTSAAASVPLEAENLPGYVRPEARTYLALPQSYIAYSADEFAAHLAERPPSAFPYLRSAYQYWGYYGSACGVTKARSYPFETGYHAMLGIIGVTFTVEHTIKALYENTMGRLFELASTDTPEDAFARQTAREYGTFLHAAPWYEFPFASKLTGLWGGVPIRGPHLLRKLERRVVMTAGYGVKAASGWLIGKASGAAYAAEAPRIHARIENATEAVFADPRVTPVKPIGSGSYVVTLPRHEEFTRTALALTSRGVRFLDIAGNDEIVVSVIARRGPFPTPAGATLVAARPMPTDPTTQRLAFSIPVRSLGEVSQQLERERAVIERLYDY